MSENHSTSLTAAISIACGVAGGVAVSFHPESVHGPVWVGLAACGAFVLAGLATLSRSRGLGRTYDWLILTILLALFAVGAWVAFGSGSRACAVSLPFVHAASTEYFCRGSFGLGAVSVGIMAIWQLVRAVKGQRAP